MVPHCQHRTNLIMPSSLSPRDRKQNPLRPSFLNKYVQLDTCPQFYKFKRQDAAETHLNHDPGDFSEAFHGGNIIERKAGDEFEQDVVEYIRNRVTEFYDLDADLTLSLVAQTHPEKVSEELPDLHSDLPEQPDVIKSGDFTYCGIAADTINLADADEFIETIESQNDEALDDANISGKFHALRACYTKSLLEDLVSNVDAFPTSDVLDVPTPETLPTGQSNAITRSNDDPIVVFQPAFDTTIGVWPFSGDADLVFIWPTTDGRARVRAVDVKLALEEKANHQIQTVAYTQAISNIDEIPADAVVLEAGVIAQNDSFDPLTPEEIPSFDRESREMDLHRLTKEGGKIDRIHAMEYTDTSFQLDDKCSSCEFNEACYTMAIENAGLELLGIDRGMQQTLRDEGIEDLNDLAELAKPIDEHVHPDKTDQPAALDQQTYNKLAQIPGLGERLPVLIQKAQVLLAELNPDNRRARNSVKPTHLTNTGYGELPADHRIYQKGNSTDDAKAYRNGSMIRVYLNVQHDHIRDSIDALGFYVTATASTTDPITYAAVDEELPDDRVQAVTAEQSVIETFAAELFDAIDQVAAGIDLSGYMQNDPFLHFYTYTANEQHVLEERLAKYTTGEITIDSTLATTNATHPSPVTVDVDLSQEARALQGLLGKRDGADQPMVSSVAEDIKARMAMPVPTTGLVNIYEKLYSSDQDEQPVPNYEWMYEPDDPSRLPDGETEADLKKVFGHRVFRNAVPYKRNGDSIRLLHGDKDDVKDGWYASRVRTAAQLPIAYIWGATGKLEDKWGDGELHDSGIDVMPFLYHSSDAKETEIAVEDLEHMIEHLCMCLARVEQGIPDRSVIKAPPLAPAEDGDT